MKKIYYIYLANLFLGFHYFLIIYINSSFLSKFVSTERINLLYMGGASVNILLLLTVPRLFRLVSAKALAAAAIAIQFFTVFFLSQTNSGTVAQILFLIEESIGFVIIYFMDLFLEAVLITEKNTGLARAVFLTAINIPSVISLFIVSRLAHDSSFSILYLVASFMLIPIFLLLPIGFEENIRKSQYINIQNAISFISKDLDILRILVSNFILQFFYTTMIIYLPLLLFKTVGFSWQQIGLLLIIMLLPFLIFEIPIGRIIDQRTGEQEFLFIGFIIMSVASFTIPLILMKSFWLWAAVLFMSRIGAALVEISSESYFFKKVNDKHSGIISFFRITAPLSFVAAPLAALFFLHFTTYAGLFGILGLITVCGVVFIPLVDTK